MALKEQIFITMHELKRTEEEISRQLHIRRYGFVRQYAHGNVLDIASGCGYGTHMIAMNPDVNSIIGVDRSKDAVAHANIHFKENNITYVNSELQDFTTEEKVDVAISLETIEHLPNPRDLVDCFIRCDAYNVIVSYPTKKSTHYNKHHLHDFTLDDITKLFSPEYEVVDTYEYFREFMFVFLQKTGP